MSAPKPGTVRLFDALVPPLVPGRYVLKARLTLDTTLGGADPLAVVAEGPAGGEAVGTLDVTAPRFRLDPSDIAATYPRNEASEAADNMVPHVMLRRRTLPWERPLEATRTVPWLAVLLFWPGEATFVENELVSRMGRPFPGASTGEAPATTTTCSQVIVSRRTLRAILPRRSELPLLCHARQLDVHEAAAQHDDDGFVAYVVGNRLPQLVTPANRASQSEQTACLVSLEGIYDLKGLWPGEPGSPEEPLTQPNDLVRLVVLHKWSFKVGLGGDFEAHWNRLKTQGNSRLFGEASQPASPPIANPLGQVELAAPARAPTTDAAAPPRTAYYAGPFVGVPLDHDKHFVRHAKEALQVSPEGPPVVSHAAAFELGRLLALASPAVLTELLSYRHTQLATVPVLDDPALDPDLLAIQDKLRSSFRDVLKGFQQGGGLGGIPGFPGDPDPEWPDRLGADPTGVRHLLGATPGLTKDHLAVQHDETRTRLVLGERWDETASAAHAAALPGALDLDAPDLGASLDALFAGQAALASKGGFR